jgi:hypothetical protein
MEALGKTYELKEGLVKPPELYLGANISKYQLPSGKDVWSISSNQYVKSSIQTVNDMLKEDSCELQTGSNKGKHLYLLDINLKQMCHQNWIVNKHLVICS